jgi:hypothetical protein
VAIARRLLEEDALELFVQVSQAGTRSTLPSRRMLAG